MSTSAAVNHLNMRYIALSIVTLLFYISINEAREVEVEVQAPWTSASQPYVVLTDVAEFITDISNPALYWSYIDELCSNTESIESALRLDAAESANELENIAYAAAGKVISSELMAVLQTSISLGAYMPASEYYHSLSQPFQNPCGSASFIVLNDNKDATRRAVLCSYDVDTIKSFNQGVGFMPSNIESDSYIHIHPKSTSSESEIYLYGIPGTESFCYFHSQISNLLDSAAHSYSYIVRYNYPQVVSNSLISPNLQGYGVFLDIKNMEYKTIDDSKSAATAVNIDALSEPLPVNEILGINLTTISTRRPELKSQLKALQDELAAVQDGNEMLDSLEPMKVWQMKDLGLQTVYSVNQVRFHSEKGKSSDAIE